MIKLQRLVESKEALARLISCSLPVGITWDLKGFIKKANVELNTFEEIKNQKVIELGEEIFDEGGKSQGTKVKPENLKEFYEIVNELFNRDIDIIIPEIKIDVLRNIKVDMSVSDLMILDWLIIE